MDSDSDIDLMVEFSESVGFCFYRLVENLEDLLGRKVNMLTKERIKNIRVKEVAESIKKDLIHV